MNREQYLAKRNEMYTQAKGFIDSGEIEKANELIDKIKNLDEEFEKQAKTIANLNALQNNGAVSPILNQIVGTQKTNLLTPPEPTAEIKIENEAYHNAFLNHLMGKPLSNEEKEVFSKFNMTAGDNTIIIPDATASKIWEKVDELFPFYAKTTKTNIKGTFTLIQEDSTFDAEFYSEEDETKTGDETFKEYSLSGCELSRAIEVSWKLKEMSMPDFENYIVRKMAKKMGAGAAHSVMTGKGKPGKEDTFKEEPNGLLTALKAEKNTPQIIEVDGIPTYSDLTNLMSKVKSAYKKELYANNIYIWNVLANITDKNGKPYFIPDPSSGGIGRLFGCTVYEDDSVGDNTLVCGDATEYQVNFNKSITIDTEDYKKKRKTAYIGYAIIDGAPITNKAFSVLTKKAAAPASK